MVRPDYRNSLAEISGTVAKLLNVETELDSIEKKLNWAEDYKITNP